MAKKTLMTGIGIQMTSVSTDSTFPLGKSYCVDINKECADNAVSNLPVYEGGSTGTTKVTTGYVTKKFLLTPQWLADSVPEESFYYRKITAYYTEGTQYLYGGYYGTNPFLWVTGYFPQQNDFSYLVGWDHFGNDITIEYVPPNDPPLAITTTQADLLPGYRNQPYNFLFKANQYAYNLQWSLVDPPQGVIMEPSGYFSLSEDGDKQVSYLLKVKVYNPDTEETATKEFTLVTAHPAYVPDSDLNDLRIEGPSYIHIKPHRNFREVWHAAGGMPPYTFTVDAPLTSQWPYRESYLFGVNFNFTSAGYGVRFDFTTNDLIVSDSPNSSNPAPFTLGTELIFEKVPFATYTNNIEPYPPSNLSLNTPYYAIPQYNSSGEYTGRIKLAATKQAALNNGPTLSWGSYGYLTGRLALPGIRDGTDAYVNTQPYRMTVNKYVQSVALSLAIPPLPKHWGHGDYWQTPPVNPNGPYYAGGLDFTGWGTSGPSNGTTVTRGGTVWTFTYGTGWQYVSGSPVWETADVSIISNKTNGFLGYDYANRFLGQNMNALGFGDSYLNGGTWVTTRTQFPFDPWRFVNFGNTASNYIDLTVKDGNGDIARLRVTVQDPDWDFSPSCGVPYWHAQMNYYKSNAQPFKNVDRETGTVFQYNAETYQWDPIPYDPELKDEYPHNTLSSRVLEEDDLDKYTYPMNVYFPASRFVDYPDTSTYGLKKETTYYPYEKLALPLTKGPFHEMSIHPITTNTSSIFYDQYGYNWDLYYPYSYFVGYGNLFRKH